MPGGQRVNGAKLKSGKHEVFVREYVRLNNATQAAILAGYSEKTAKQQGSRLLSYVDVWTAISEARQRQAEQTRELVAQETRGKAMDEARWLAGLTAIAEADITDVFTPGPDGKLVMSMAELKKSGMGKLVKKIKVLKDGKVEIEMHPKLQAYALLGARQGWVRPVGGGEDLPPAGGAPVATVALSGELVKSILSDSALASSARQLALAALGPTTDKKA
jgi:phage terminase small subunit